MDISVLQLAYSVFSSTLSYRQIPTAYSKANGGTAIPLPATVMVQRRCPPDKVRPLPPTPNHTPCKLNLKKIFQNSIKIVTTNIDGC